MRFIDTHIHLDASEFDEDREMVIQRAIQAGACKMFIPAIDLPTTQAIIPLCRQYPQLLYPMAGLHPEEVRDDYHEVLQQIKACLPGPYIAIGEVGLDFYWSREFENQQLEAFECQVQWACDLGMPLMIHCRKAQNELVGILRKYKARLHGGVFHCFTGNLTEARQLLEFDGFALGIGGVLTFKKSKLPEVVQQIPLSRIVVETDAPYMAPVPMRGKRNESSFLTNVIQQLAVCYDVDVDTVATTTTNNALSIFSLAG